MGVLEIRASAEKRIQAQRDVQESTGFSKGSRKKWTGKDRKIQEMMIS